MPYITIGPGQIRLPQLVIPRPVMEEVTDIAKEEALDFIKSPIVWLALFAGGSFLLNLFMARRRR